MKVSQIASHTCFELFFNLPQPNHITIFLMVPHQGLGWVGLGVTRLWHIEENKKRLKHHHFTDSLQPMVKLFF